MIQNYDHIFTCQWWDQHTKNGMKATKKMKKVNISQRWIGADKGRMI